MPLHLQERELPLLRLHLMMRTLKNKRKNARNAKLKKRLKRDPELKLLIKEITLTCISGLRLRSR
jgi:hypothetical protein